MTNWFKTLFAEQAEGSLDIDTRTDVYSLGVLLYELLTGTTPFSGKDLRAAAFGEIQRIIREVEPPKPSTRISHNTDTIASVAAKRHTEPKRLGTTVRGELDWIVMKALEKDRQRRYETANGLAMDIGRYLSGEAVVAAPPSAAYRVKKFVRRNRVMVTAGSAVAAALLIGVIAFAWQASVAREQRDFAGAVGVAGVVRLAGQFLGWGLVIEEATTAAWTVAALLAAAGALRAVFRPAAGRAEPLYAALSAYLLVGLFLGILYWAIAARTPEAILVMGTPASAATFTQSTAIYFSFVTLATLGYGDILPATEVTRALVVLETVGGQLYLAVLVARLVGVGGPPPRS